MWVIENCSCSKIKQDHIWI